VRRTFSSPLSPTFFVSPQGSCDLSTLSFSAQLPSLIQCASVSPFPPTFPMLLPFLHAPPFQQVRTLNCAFSAFFISPMDRTYWVSHSSKCQFRKEHFVPLAYIPERAARWSPFRFPRGSCIAKFRDGQNCIGLFAFPGKFYPGSLICPTQFCDSLSGWSTLAPLFRFVLSCFFFRVSPWSFLHNMFFFARGNVQGRFLGFWTCLYRGLF